MPLLVLQVEGKDPWRQWLDSQHKAQHEAMLACPAVGLAAEVLGYLARVGEFWLGTLADASHTVLQIEGSGLNPWGRRHEDALLRTLWSASISMAWGEQFTHISEVQQEGAGVRVTLITNAFPQAVSLDKVGSSRMAGIHGHLRDCRLGIGRA